MIGTADKIVTFLLQQIKLNPEKKFKLDEYHQKRSLNANSYCWILCDKIAKEMSKDGTIITKEEIYKDAIKQIGTFEPMIIETKAFETFKRIWESQGLGFIIQKVGEKDKAIKIHAYYGSHTYNSQEMSLLINLLVELAKSLNIETKPQQEIDSLINNIKEKKRK